MRTFAVVVAFVPAVAACAGSPVQVEWSMGPEMPNPTAGGATAIIGDDLIVAGGTFWHTMDAKRYVPWPRIYDIASGEWRMGPDLPFAARALSALALDDRRIHIFGPHVQSARDAAIHGQQHAHSSLSSHHRQLRRRCDAHSLRKKTSLLIRTVKVSRPVS